jgi:hypothetical protein
VRRIEFGTPISSGRDGTSGLLFMTLKAPGTGGKDPIRVRDGGGGGEAVRRSPSSPESVIERVGRADCVALVSARHGATAPFKLTLSAAQARGDSDNQN